MHSLSLNLPLRWRDRLVSSQRFRSWAAAFPLTRPIARRRTRALFDLCAGFVYSQILHACVELRLFDMLAGGPLTLPALAHRTGLPQPAMERLLLAAISLKLLNKRKDGYGLGPLGAAMVGNAAIAGMVQHHRMLYADLADPVALLRNQDGTQLGQYWAYARAQEPGALQDTHSADYTALMAASQPLVAGEILRAYSFAAHKRLLDVGGGNGAFLAAVTHATPGLQAMLFDLPPVAERARLAHPHIDTHGGDFSRDSLPKGADVISLVRVIHDHDDALAQTILNAARAALPPGGTLILAEPMAGTSGAEPIGDAYFGMYLLAMGSGRARTRAELSAMLARAGFDQIRHRRTDTPLLVSVLTAVNGN